MNDTPNEDTFHPALGGSDVQHGDHVDEYWGHDTADGAKMFECPKGSNRFRWEGVPESPDVESKKSPEDVLLEAKVRTFDDAVRKLRKLVNQTQNFEEFKSKLQSFTRFYLGDPMPEPMRTWGWAQFQQFYEENKR